ncbi:MAG: hypothetical protein GXO28_04735 [Methanopyri archaeon]|nr:hypothetical protein [Methanopyri archaeon]
MISRDHGRFVRKVLSEIPLNVKFKVIPLTDVESEDEALTRDGRLREEEPWRRFVHALTEHEEGDVVCTAVNVPPETPKVSTEATVVVGVNTGNHPTTMNAVRVSDVLVVGRRVYCPGTGPRLFDPVPSGRLPDGTVVVNVEDIGCSYASEAVPVVGAYVEVHGVEGLVKGLEGGLASIARDVKHRVPPPGGV